MKLEIETSDRELAFPHRETVDLGSGVHLICGTTTVRTGADIPHYLIEWTIQISAGVPSGVATHLLIKWLWPRKDRIEKISLEKTEIEFDDQERLKKIIIEKIEKQPVQTNPSGV